MSPSGDWTSRKREPVAIATVAIRKCLMCKGFLEVRRHTVTTASIVSWRHQVRFSECIHFADTWTRENEDALHQVFHAGSITP
jgi:hypothetical protein